MEELLPVTDETARLVGRRSASALYKLIQRRAIPFVRLGARVFIKPSALEALIKTHTVEPVEPKPANKRRGAA